jgi:hypothetical protein
MIRKPNRVLNNQQEEFTMRNEEFLENYKEEQAPIALTAAEAMDIL